MTHRIVGREDLPPRHHKPRVHYLRPPDNHVRPNAFIDLLKVPASRVDAPRTEGAALPTNSHLLAFIITICLVVGLDSSASSSRLVGGKRMAMVRKGYWKVLAMQAVPTVLAYPVCGELAHALVFGWGAA